MQTKKEKLKVYVTDNIDKLYRLAFSYARDEQYAEDIVNESVARALSSINTLKNDSYMGTWVYRIVVNTANTYLKKQSKIIYLDESDDLRTTEDKYRDNDLYEAVMKLDSKYREVIILRFFEDMSLEKISMVLSENVNTIKTRLYTALEKLRKYMEKDVKFDERIF